ncbi:MAG: tRNA lysidine(34) synthetase TilS [Anaerolineaceae bacterium]|nr:tRNA lysidine(34) synthetase TilS [Anaerolineaceae bacterium]
MKKVNKSTDINNTLTQITQICDLKEEKIIVAGVSGGADSLCLLHCLQDLGYKITAVYVDHGLRKASVDDGEHVRAICSSWGIPFVLSQVDVNSFSTANKFTVEEASRVLRYRELFRIADDLKAQAVAVAHHADDQIETVLMHLLRGSGMSGLRGMQPVSTQHGWHKTIPLIRPLISTWKIDIENYCDKYEIKPILDETNLDTTFFRNRLRHELIPQLLTYNSAFKQGLLRTTKILQNDYVFLVELLEDECNRINMTELLGQVTFQMGAFSQAPLNLQRMILRRVVSLLRPDLRDVGFDAIERAIHFIKAADTSKQIDIVNNLILFIDSDLVVLGEKGKVYLRADLPLLYEHKTVNLVPGKSFRINDFWFVSIEHIKDISEAGNFRDNAQAYTAYIDADKCGLPIKLKTIQPGDRFPAYGLNGHTQKLSDIMINQKISRWVRPFYPIIWNQDGIVWVPGYRIAENMQIESTSKRFLRLSFFQKQTE